MADKTIVVTLEMSLVLRARAAIYFQMENWLFSSNHLWKIIQFSSSTYFRFVLQKRNFAENVVVVRSTYYLNALWSDMFMMFFIQNYGHRWKHVRRYLYFYKKKLFLYPNHCLRSGEKWLITHFVQRRFPIFYRRCIKRDHHKSAQWHYLLLKSYRQFL